MTTPPLHPMIKAQLSMLAAEADLQIAKLNMRRDSIRSLQPQSGAARMRLTEEAFEQHKIAAGYRYLLSIIEVTETSDYDAKTIDGLIQGMKDLQV